LLFQFGDLGGIEDVALGQRWTNGQLASEVAGRVAALAAAGIRSGSTLVIAHSGSARFFADLFAVWQLGCSAACLGEGLTAAELRTLVDFVRPAAILVDQVAPPIRVDVPVLQLASARHDAAAVREPDADPRGAALVLFTSGTT
jgi:acyl-CoA synthetase (AMP-forming)/AMP-acid ligase II